MYIYFFLSIYYWNVIFLKSHRMFRIYKKPCIGNSRRKSLVDRFAAVHTHLCNRVLWTNVFFFRRNFFLHGTTGPPRRCAEKEPAKSNSRLALFDHILHRLLTPPSKGTLLKYITRCIARWRAPLRDKYALRLSNHSRGSPISRALTILSSCPLQHAAYNVKILGVN